jgi:hypothetical protein
MRSVSAEALLSVPLFQAWEKLQDLTLAKAYVPGVTDIEITTPNRTGLGASRKVAVKGRPALDETVVQWEEGHGFTVELHQGDKPASPFRQARFTYWLNEAPEGLTRVTTTLSYDLPLGIVGRMFDALLMRFISANMVKTISRNLKKVYEAAPAGS